MDQLKSIYNSSFKNTHSHLIHTCLGTIASNEGRCLWHDFRFLWAGLCGQDLRQKPMEFFLNEFPWIQRIQRIMTKSQSGMVTKGITQLATNTLPVLVIQSSFSLLQLGGYLLSITTLNRYQPRDSSRKIFLPTTSSNTSIVSYVMSLVTILFLDLIKVHWIRWIQRNTFRKNSNMIHITFITVLDSLIY